jgi:hypothetical protein
VKEGTLAFGGKRARSIIVSSLAKSHFLSPRPYVPARKRSVQLFSKFVVCFGFLSFHRLLPSLPTCIDTV